MIQYLFRRLCFVLGMALVVSASNVQALDIVKDGKPCATIVVAEDTLQYQKWAAQWLQEYVEKVTGAKLEIVSETNALGSGVLISVGHTKLAKKAKIKTDDLKYDGCILLVKDRVLYLIGRDYVPPKDAKPDNYLNPENGRPHGTIRAVTTFLEDIAGVRWYLPGPEGTFIPTMTDLIVPDTLDKTFVPYLAYTIGGIGDFTAIARYANNSRSTVNFKLLGGDGTWEAAVPIKQYFTNHPEYFHMDNTGKRNPGARTQAMLCTSNREVWKLILEWMRKQFDAGCDGVELGQSDGYQVCLCPECQKAYGDGEIPVSADCPGERIWVMHKWIYDELAKSHPDKKIVQTIYGPTRFPSKRFERLPDNVIVEMFSVPPNDEFWKDKCRTYTAGYFYFEEDCMQTGIIPPVGPEWFQKCMKKYRAAGVIGAHTRLIIPWGLGGPTAYIYFKLLGDTDIDIDKLLSEYCQGVYGESGQIMERFFRLFHSRSNMSLREDDFRPCPAPRLKYPNGNGAEDAITSLYPPAIVSQMDWLLKKAEKTAKRERAKGWLRYTRDHFDGLRTMAEMFAAKRAFELQPTKELLQLVKEKVDAFEEWRARIIAYSTDKAYIQRWFPGYYQFCNSLLCKGSRSEYERLYYHESEVVKELEKVVKGERKVRGTVFSSTASVIREPITWDFEKMQAGLGRTIEEKKVHVQRATIKPGMDGALDLAAWANTAALPFEAYKSANSRLGAATTVRLLYDDERLYVRYECSEPNIDNLKLKSVGRDGNVYYLDEVELFLNPECSSRKMMHFMAAPVKDAMYDERKGYIDDPLDPRYSAVDIAWNADWTYTYTIDKENKRWFLDMAVPFKSIGAGAPASGTVWTVNFARARRAGDFEELSCWIAEDFGNPEVFGELIFGDKGEKPTGGTTPGPQSNKTVKQSDQSVVAADSAGNEIVKNGGFEKVGDDKKPVSWAINSWPELGYQPIMNCCSVTTEKAHGGQSSLKIDFQNIKPDATWKSSQIVFGQVIDAETVKRLKGKDVVLSAWLYYEYRDEDSKGGEVPGPYIIVRASDKDEKLIPNSKSPQLRLNHAECSKYWIDSAQGIGKWIRVEQRGQIPDAAEHLDIHCGLVAWDKYSKEANATSVYIDDIRLEVVESQKKSV